MARVHKDLKGREGRLFNFMSRNTVPDNSCKQLVVYEKKAFLGIRTESKTEPVTTSNHIVAGPHSQVVLVFVPGKNGSCPVIFAEFIFLMFPFIYSSLNYFEHTLTEADVRLQLWRKVAKPQRNGYRKVHAMWTVRKTLNAARTYF